MYDFLWRAAVLHRMSLYDVGRLAIFFFFFLQEPFWILGLVVNAS